MRFGKGFIAALDQSGGSTPKAHAQYGIPLEVSAPVVADTMVLIDDVLQGMRKGRPTARRCLIAIADVNVSAAVVDETRKTFRGEVLA